MTARRIILPEAMPARDNNGRALPSKLFFYAPGTTTPKSVYTSSGLTVAHSFPVLSDSSGRFDAIWADDAEKFDVAWTDKANDAVQARWENISPLSDALTASASTAESAATAASTSQTEAANSATSAANSATKASDAAATAVAIAGFDPTDYVAKTRLVSTSGLASGGGNLTADRTIAVPAAIGADWWFLNSTTVAGTPASVAKALEEVTLTDAATIAVDLNTFINAAVTLGGNRTLGAPTNAVPGETGRIRIIQDATGSRTLAYGAGWKFAGGTAPSLSTAAGSIDILEYEVISSSFILASLSKGWA